MKTTGLHSFKCWLGTRIREQLVTFNKEKIVFQQWIVGIEGLVTRDSWPNPLVLSRIKGNSEICQVSISNYFLLTQFCLLQKLPRELLSPISPDLALLSIKQVPLGSTLFGLGVTVSSFDTQVPVWSLQYWLTLSLESQLKCERPFNIIPWTTCVRMGCGELQHLRQAAVTKLSQTLICIWMLNVGTKTPAWFVQLQLQPEGKEIRVPMVLALIFKYRTAFPPSRSQTADHKLIFKIFGIREHKNWGSAKSQNSHVSFITK